MGALKESVRKACREIAVLVFSVFTVVTAYQIISTMRYEAIARKFGGTSDTTMQQFIIEKLPFWFCLGMFYGIVLWAIYRFSRFLLNR